VELTNEDVADVLALLDSLPYDSLDLETPRFRLTLRRAPGGTGWTEESQVLTEPAVLAPSPDAAPASASAGFRRAGQPEPVPATAAPPAAITRPDDASGDGLAAVTAPLPGTFYRAPRPGADPFVQVGDEVTPDTVVAIIETMKLMNPVHAGTAGRVARIALDNGEFAPLGTTLLLIQPEP
jgi:acetyl-CoA carboxylase biotin carboxyl carrier protein